MFTNKDGNLKIGKIIAYAIGGLLTFSLIMGSFYIVGGTEYAVERTPSGEMQGVVEPGIHFKVPFLSSVHFYDQFQTVAYVDDEDGEGVGTMKRINFADTYGGYVGGTIRYKLSSNPDLLVEMHKAYVNENNLIESGLKPISKQLLVYTANQITGEDFMQGGQNEYQIRVEDQGNNGLYITKREKILVKKNTSDVGLKDQNPQKRPQRDSYIFRTVIQKDKNGIPLRQELPITKYGIKIVQVTIDDFRPEKKLNDFINRKKEQIAIRQKLVEEQENERQSAVTAELRGNRERIEARQKMLKEKDAAVIEAQKRVDLEQKEAELQIVRKKKELEIAKANEGIQIANAIAAKHQAQAIESKGLAEAKVKKAMYNAVRKDVLVLEVKKITEVAKYKALKESQIVLPKTVIMSGGSGKDASSSLAQLTDLSIMGKIDQMDKENKNKKE